MLRAGRPECLLTLLGAQFFLTIEGAFLRPMTTGLSTSMTSARRTLMKSRSACGVSRSRSMASPLVSYLFTRTRLTARPGAAEQVIRSSRRFDRMLEQTREDGGRAVNPHDRAVDEAALAPKRMEAS